MTTKKKNPTDHDKATNGHSNGATNGAPALDEKIEAMIKRFTVKRVDNAVDKYFRALVKLQGSDLHMKVGNHWTASPSKSKRWLVCCFR